MEFKSTKEILNAIKGRKGPDIWQEVTGIPKFEPLNHSDGCSGGMSAGYARLPKAVRDRFGNTLPWCPCCVEHDRAYYYGGSREQKKAADEALKQCVAQTLDNETVGWISAQRCRWQSISVACPISPPLTGGGMETISAVHRTCRPISTKAKINRYRETASCRKICTTMAPMRLRERQV